MIYLEEIKKALEIRLLESKLLELFKEGELNGTVHTCVGQELVGVFVCKNLQDRDFVVSNHRGHGHYLSRTSDARGLLAELMGRTSGCSGGVGGSQHLVNDHCSETLTAWKALGEVDYGKKSSELGSVKFRRSLYFTREMLAGSVITEQDVRSVRPGFGLPPKYLESILGKRLLVDVNYAQPVSFECFEP